MFASLQLLEVVQFKDLNIPISHDPQFYGIVCGQVEQATTRAEKNDIRSSGDRAGNDN